MLIISDRHDVLILSTKRSFCGGEGMRQWLYDIRNERNLSQAYVALNAKISRQYYNFIEHGERRPSPQVAKRIAKVLDFPSEWYKLLES